jgi:uncharacterized protein YukE
VSVVVHGAVSSIDWEARVRDLWAFLDDVRSLGFSFDPLDVLDNLSALWDVVNTGWDLMTEPPPGEPDAAREAAARWSELRSSLDAVSGTLTTQRASIRDSWTGEAANACRTSLRKLGASLDDSAELADTARRTLETYADELETAHARHAQVGEHLRSAGARIGPCSPWGVADMLRDIIADVCDAARAAIDAYSGASEAARVCDHALDIVTDRMPFPDGVVGLTAVDSINLVDDPGDETRPLVGDTARRAQEAYDALSPSDRAAVDALLAGSPGPQHKAWVLAALAGGNDVVTLGRFAQHISGIDTEGLALVLDPTNPDVTRQSTTGSSPMPVLHQTTDTTCGSASLIVARMLADPVYALRMLGGYDSATGTSVPGGSTPDGIAERFAKEEQAVQGRTNSVVDRSGGLKLPWPSAVGTSPWGASEEMNNGAGIPGTGYHVSMIDSDSPADAQRAYDEVARAVDSGRPVPMYTGSDNAPRHVVLVVGRDVDGALQIYNPADGTVNRVSESGFVSGGDELYDAGSWRRPWAVITP